MNSHPSGPRVFVVDDDHDTLDTVWTFLKANLPDAIVFPFPTTDEALGAVSLASPDVILADYRMPGMDGIEFLRRAHDLAPDAQQVLMTGMGELRGEPSDETHVVHKPFDARGLLALMHSCLAAP